MNLVNPYNFTTSGQPAGFVGYGASNGTAILVPAGVVNGNFLIAFAGADVPGDLAAPAGWTQLGTTKTWATYGLAVYYRVASSEPASYDFTASYYAWGHMLAYNGPTQIDNSGSFQEFTTTSCALTGITCAAGSTLIASIHSRDTTSLVQPSGMTERVAETNQTYWLCGHADLDSASSANREYTRGGNTYDAVGILVSIKP